MAVAVVYNNHVQVADSFSTNRIHVSSSSATAAAAFTKTKTKTTKLQSSNGGSDENSSYDANKWQSSSIPPYGEQQDWEETLSARQDGSLWSSFASDDNGDDESNQKSSSNANADADDDGEEAWFDAIAQISADEIDFINVEADRADKVRQMQEMEFSSESIAATLGVEVDDSKEVDAEENELLEKFKEETGKAGGGFGLYVEEEYDMETVESHVMVEIDEETNEPIRQQMVYVDEHTCIGCTNCAMVCWSTFDVDVDVDVKNALFIITVVIFKSVMLLHSCLQTYI